LGTWKIISKDTWGEGFGGAWMGFNVPYGKFGIHGTTHPWLIGKSNSSKGCIRMNNNDVQELYKIVPYGTTVTIVHSDKIFRTMKSGDIGSDIVELQKSLKKLGYYHGGADGKFGTGLKQGIIKFQQDNRLWGSGKVDKKTYSLIVEKAKLLDATIQ
jgi:lipoprotein-anchoring transpeptidase ErfK/SrfK